MTENRITRLVQQDRKLLIAYYMPEFPVPGSTLPVLEALQASRADLIELGMPYSDPIGDGPVIQQAAHTAISHGVTLRSILETVGKARKGDGCPRIDTPILLMGYSNPIFAYGLEAFMADAAASGVDGLLIPDLPPEESAVFLESARAAGISVINLISPTTPPERIELIDSLSSDFSYCLAVNATTGTAKLDDAGMDLQIATYLERVRKHAKKKFVVGFGIRDRERVHRMWELADGAVVGTALLQHIEKASTPEEAASMAAGFWQSLQ